MLATILRAITTIDSARKRLNDIPNELGKTRLQKHRNNNNNNEWAKASKPSCSSVHNAKSCSSGGSDDDSSGGGGGGGVEHTCTHTSTPVLISRWNFCYWRIKNYRAREWDSIFVYVHCILRWLYRVPPCVRLLARSHACLLPFIRSAASICDLNLCTCISFNKKHRLTI